MNLATLDVLSADLVGGRKKDSLRVRSRYLGFLKDEMSAIEGIRRLLIQIRTYYIVVEVFEVV